MQIIVKQSYSHINKSFGDWDTPQGKLVKNKDHYDRLMKENGMISYEESMARSKPKDKPYELSKKGWDIINAARNSKDKNGNVKLSDKTIDAMKEIGAIGKSGSKNFDTSKLNPNKGGFISKKKEYAQGFSL